MEERAKGAVIGGCGLHPRAPREWEVGYVFAREAWGLGFATETVRALCRFGFETLAAHRLRAGVFVGNHASAHVLEKLGFTREGHLRQTHFVRGAWHDEWVYALP